MLGIATKLRQLLYLQLELDSVQRGFKSSPSAQPGLQKVSKSICVVSRSLEEKRICILMVPAMGTSDTGPVLDLKITLLLGLLWRKNESGLSL